MTAGGGETAGAGLPLTAPGQTIGLLGGSFDPPHEGHLHITMAALRRFRLSQVWWLVSPGNPLKPKGPAPMARRMGAAKRLIDHPRVHVTDAEARLGTRYTADTLRTLLRARPRVRFVWLMGADNLASLHQWEDWEEIMSMVPVGVLARPGSTLHAGLSPAARRYARYRLSPLQSTLLAQSRPPAWCFVTLPLVAVSSTAIRERGAWSGVATE